MTGVEKKMLMQSRHQGLWLYFIGITAIAIYLRSSVSGFTSIDFIYWLSPWYDEIRQYGLAHQVGNYNILYQFSIYVMTLLPFDKLYAYKVFSCVFDFVIALSGTYLVWLAGYRETPACKLAVAYSLLLMAPTIFLNSAMWAQCDSIYTAFVLLAVCCLLMGRRYEAFLAIGIGLAFKLQAVLALPFFVWHYLYSRNYSIAYWLVSVAVFVAAGLLALPWGRGILESMSIYMGQMAEYPNIVYNYPSFWVLLCNNYTDVPYVADLALAVTAGALFMLGSVCLNKTWRNGASAVQAVEILFLLSYAAVLFLPHMHERYGYMYEVLAIVLACVRSWMIVPAVVLQGLSVVTYGFFLNGEMYVQAFGFTDLQQAVLVTRIIMPFLAVLNIAVFVYCAQRIIRHELEAEKS